MGEPPASLARDLPGVVLPPGEAYVHQSRRIGRHDPHRSEYGHSFVPTCRPAERRAQRQSRMPPRLRRHRRSRRAASLTERARCSSKAERVGAQAGRGSAPSLCSRRSSMLRVRPLEPVLRRARPARERIDDRDGGRPPHPQRVLINYFDRINSDPGFQPKCGSSGVVPLFAPCWSGWRRRLREAIVAIGTLRDRSRRGRAPPDAGPCPRRSGRNSRSSRRA